MPVRQRLKTLFGKSSRDGKDDPNLVIRHKPSDPSQIAAAAVATAVPASQSSPSPGVNNQTARSSVPTSPTSTTLKTSTTSAKAPLWDRAYDKLKEANNSLVTEYEELLSKQMATINASSPNTIDPNQRQKRLNLIVQRGLQEFESRKTKYSIAGHTYVLQDQISQVVSLVQDVKDFVSSAVSSSPQASLVWAGVCIILPLLTNPSTAEKANHDGFTYVTSRMEYYTKLEYLLLPRRGRDATSQDEFEELRAELEKFLVDLYQQILNFQLRSILRFYRNSALNFLRDVTRHENWGDMLQGIKDAEGTLDAKSRQVSDQVSVRYLANVDYAADRSYNALRGVLAKIEESLELARQQRLIASQQLDVQTQIAQKILSEDERKCHQIFRLVKDENSNPYEWYKDRVEERVEGTCQWFLAQPHFKKWLQAESGLLTVSADPGCGKSVLARFLIDHHLPKAAATANICYFFFKDQDQNTLRQALCALLHQLFSLKPILIHHAMEHYETNGANLVNITSLLFSILKKASEDPEAGSVIFVVDALDECSIPDLQEFIKMLRKQFGSDNWHPWKAKFLLTSRPYEHVMSEFRLLTESSAYIHIPGENESEAISQEVNCVIRHRVKYLEKEKDFSSDLSEYLLSKLLAMPHRTYLWVYLVFEDMKSQDFRRTKKGVDAVINTLPESVNEAYEKILQKSKKNERSMVRKALSIILAARRPLSLAEMNIAVNVNIDSKSDEDLDLESEQDFGKRLRSWCGLFISLFQDKVYFLHQTAREFLLFVETSSPVQPSLNSLQTWNGSITSEQAHLILVVSCIVYLDALLLKNMRRAEFLAYAAESWVSHYHGCGKDLEKRLDPFLARLCDPEDPGFGTWYEIYNPDDEAEAFENSNTLSVAASLGIHSLVKHLIASNKGLDVDEKDDDERTPLAYAAEGGHEEVVRLLLKTGKVNVNSSDWEGLTPIYDAIEEKHDAVIHLLLDTGKVDMNRKQYKGRTPLAHASQTGNEAAVRLFLEKYDYLEVDSRDEKGRSALSYAAENGSEGIVQLLLDTGKANVDSRCSKGRTTLSYASQQGHEGVVRLLLGTGKVKPDSMSAKRRTPLSYAAEFGRNEIIKLLLETGNVNVDAKDKTSQTPLHWASAEGHTEAVRLLLDLGKANPDVLDHNDSTPLRVAMANSYLDIVNILEAKQQMTA